MGLGGDGLVNLHTLLILCHVAAAHRHFAVAHRQIERHARIVGVGGVTLGENLRSGRVILVVESVAALYLVNLGNPAVRFGHLVHIAVKLRQLGRLGEILQRLLVILGFQCTAAQHEVAFGKRGLGDGHQRSGGLVVHALVDYLFEFCGGSREVLVSESCCSFVIHRRKILRRKRHRCQQRDYRYQ